MAIVVKRNSTSYNALIGLHTSGGTATYALEIEDNAGGNSIDFTGNTGWATTLTNADGWCLIAVTKASGTVAPTAHKYVYAANTWEHTASGATTANAAASTGGTVRFGEWQDVDDFAGDIAVAGIWDRSLTDAEIETLAFTLQAWYAAAPVGLWVFDQSATTQNVVDQTGNGANQTGTGGTLVGTVVSTNNAPLFNYADGARAVTRQPAAAPSTVQPTLTLLGVGA